MSYRQGCLQHSNLQRLSAHNSVQFRCKNERKRSRAAGKSCLKRPAIAIESNKRYSSLHRFWCKGHQFSILFEAMNKKRTCLRIAILYFLTFYGAGEDVRCLQHTRGTQDNVHEQGQVKHLISIFPEISTGISIELSRALAGGAKTGSRFLFPHF